MITLSIVAIVITRNIVDSNYKNEDGNVSYASAVNDNEGNDNVIVKNFWLNYIGVLKEDIDHSDYVQNNLEGTFITHRLWRW